MDRRKTQKHSLILFLATVDRQILGKKNNRVFNVLCSSVVKEKTKFNYKQAVSSLWEKHSHQINR